MENHQIMQVFVEAEAGSHEKRQYDESTLEYKGVRRVSLAYPYPYGFIMKTKTEDGDGIDAYILTRDSLEAGDLYTCEPVGMLEVFEGDEIDHKTLTCLTGQAIEVDREIIETLQNFILEIFKNSPEVKISFGKTRSNQETIEYIKKHTIA